MLLSTCHNHETEIKNWARDQKDRYYSRFRITTNAWSRLHSHSLSTSLCPDLVGNILIEVQNGEATEQYGFQV